MVLYDWTRIVKVGDSQMLRVPSKIIKDKAYPFKEEENEYVMEIFTDKDGRKGLFIRKP